METQPAPGPGGTAVVPGAGAKSRGLPQPGEQLGHYTIARPLGVGGMGAVYEAQDLESGRRVALKVLSHTAGFAGGARAVLPRRAAGGLHQPSQQRLYLRHGGDRRHAGHCDGTGVGRDVAGPGAGAGAVAGRRGGGRGAANDRGAGGGAAAGHSAPRHQAVQLLRGRGRHGEDRRLRPVDLHGRSHGTGADGRPARSSARQRSARPSNCAGRNSTRARTCIRWARRSTTC